MQYELSFSFLIIGLIPSPGWLRGVACISQNLQHTRCCYFTGTANYIDSTCF